MLQTDTSLLCSWRDERDADAFTMLVERHSGMVFATARRILRDAGQAEDVAQECFLKLGQLEEPKGPWLGALLHTMATREALKRLDTEARRRRREETYSQQARATQDPEWDDVAPHVDEAMATLPENLHTPLVARYLEDKTYADIARSLGLDESTIRYRTRKAIDEVRKSLRRKGITLGVAAVASLLKANAIQAAPSALTSTLGAAAIAGVSGRVAPTLASALFTGGDLLWKKAVVGLGIAMLLAGSWTATTWLSGSEDGEDSAKSVSGAMESEEVSLATSVARGSLDDIELPLETIEPTRGDVSTVNNLDSSARTSLVDISRSLAEFMDKMNSSPEKSNGRSFDSSDIPEDNGAHYFMLAFEMTVEEDFLMFLDKWNDAGSPGDLLNDPEVLDMLERFQPILDLIREGLAVGNAMLPEPLAGPYEELPYLSYWRNLARLMTLEAQLFEANENIDAAIRNYVDALEFDTESGRGGTLIGGLVGYAGNRTVLEGLQRLIDSGQIDPLTYPELIAQLNAIEMGSLTAFDLQVGESEYFDTWMIRQLQEGQSFQDFFNDPGSQLNLPRLSEEAYRSFFDEFLGHREHVIEMSALPFYEAQNFDMEALINGNPISEALLPAVLRVMNTATHNQVGIRGTTTMAALDWYHADNGVYPASLDALVPGYLAETPVDLYTGELLIYRADEGDYTLYSTGVDMEDNLGVPGDVADAGTDMVFRQSGQE